MTPPLRNVFACLVHERQEVVVDLVRNLRRLDPDSQILLYDGGRDPGLLQRRFSVDGDEPLVHPNPQPLAWGALHRFALDCFRFAGEVGFDTLTIVDSDQLALRPGYSAHLAAHLAGRDGVGLLGNAPGPQPADTKIAPVAQALRELDLWRPFLRRFPDGERKFAHWTFWPSTVFTADAARDLVQLLEDEELQSIMARSRIWATEEVVLPTLVALLGYEIAQSPCSYDFVKYNVLFTPAEVERALARTDAFWLHPVPRAYDHPLRRQLRERFDHYRPAVAPEPKPAGGRPLLLTAPILARMRSVDGWLSDEEGELLAAATARALAELPAPHALVEAGCYCGRATVVLGSVASALSPDARVYAVDAHDGAIGSLDEGVRSVGPTLERFRGAIGAAGLEGIVEEVVEHPHNVRWDAPIAFAVIDGLHDYASVSRDFDAFDPWVVRGGYVAFHDYADYFPGVTAFVDELLATGRYGLAERAGSLVVLRKLVAATGRRRRPRAIAAVVAAPAPVGPLVTCVMPTYGRRRFVPLAVECFRRQEHERLELLVLDDDPEGIADLLPRDERIRHLRLPSRLTIGAKRNLGAEEARGELVAHWDDDDWSAPRRIRCQVEALTGSGADVCGLSTLLYVEIDGERAWRYAWPPTDRPWVADGTLLYSKDFWRRNPFPDTSQGLDCSFLWNNRPKHVLALDDETIYVAALHAGNTSPKDTSGALWQPWDRARIDELLGPDAAFYRA